MDNEPALIVGFIGSALILAVAFGVPISPDQQHAILAFVSAGIMFFGSVIIRQNVSPTK